MTYSGNVSVSPATVTFTVEGPTGRVRRRKPYPSTESTNVPFRLTFASAGSPARSSTLSASPSERPLRKKSPVSASTVKFTCGPMKLAPV